MDPQVLIILVNYKGAELTIECVRSLLEMRYRNWQCVIYENGSEDASYDKITAGLKALFPVARNVDDVGYSWHARSFSSTHLELDRRSVLLINGDTNLGFAGGNNEAYYAACKWSDFQLAAYYWFLNNDTVVDRSSLDEVIRRFSVSDDMRIGLCGSTLMYFDSDSIIQCFSGAQYFKWSGRVVELGNGQSLADLSNSEVIEQKLDYVSGASAVASYEFLEVVGLMSTEYFLYFEELDWAQRAKKAGFSLAFAPKSLVWHKEGAVLGSGKSSTRSPLAEFYGLRSKLRFTARYHPLALPGIWIIGCIQLLRRLGNSQFNTARSLARALIFKDRY